MRKQRPNFLFIGPDKSGSTWLYRALREHRQAYLPRAKEIFFFDRFYDRGWSWYESFFKGASEDRNVLGEISHDYLFSPIACERIARELPSVKLMVCLRNPEQRAFSSYLYMIKQGRVNSDFDTALKEVKELVEHGRYAKYLGSYLEAFGRDRIHISIFDDLVADPQRFFDNVCDFLEIDRMPLPSELKGSVLPAAQPRYLFWARLMRNIGWYVRRMGMPGVVGWIKELTLVDRILYKTYHSNDKPEMSSAARTYLHKVFSPEVQQLDTLLGTDLSTRWGYSAATETIEPSES